MSDTESINSTTTFVLKPDSSKKIPFRDFQSSLDHKEYREARTFVRPTVRDGVTKIAPEQRSTAAPVDEIFLTRPKVQSKETREQIAKEENDLDIENIEDLDEAALLSLPWPDDKETKPKKRATEDEKALAEIDENLQTPAVRKVKNTKLSNRRDGDCKQEGESPDNAETLFQEELERMYNPPKPGEEGYVNLDIPLPSSTTYTYQMETDSEDERKFEEIKKRQKQEELVRQKEIQERKKAKKNKKKKEKVSHTKVVSISISQNDANDTKPKKGKYSKKTKKTQQMERASKSAPSNKPILTGVHHFDADDNGDDDEGKVGALRRIRYGLMRFGRYVRKQLTKCSCTSAQIAK